MNTDTQDRFYTPDKEYFLEFEEALPGLPWRSHARLWHGRRSYFVPALFGAPPVWDDAALCWFAPVWTVGQMQKLACIEPEMRRISMSTQEFQPFTLIAEAGGNALKPEYIEPQPGLDAMSLPVEFGRPRRF